MRTAKTLAETHDGKEVLIFGRNVPLQDQHEAFRKLLGQPSHPEFANVTYQERDGVERIIRFRSPAAQKSHDELRAEESKAHEAASKPKEPAAKKK